jgi:outer membrane protein OmpA-like peptidoglycan-associated protein
MDTMKFYEIIVKSENHLRYKDIIKNYGREKVLRKDIYLQGVAEGSSLIFEDIYFFGGNDVFKPESRAALTRLLNIMKDNPSLAIEIQGHVNQPLNQPKTYSDEYYLDLSERRAKAVYDYLTKRGIDENRIKYKGFGYSKMLYPYATKPDEMQKNRRVEILILGF